MLTAGGAAAQGSDPLPGESEADYVARQRQLQNEVRLHDETNLTSHLLYSYILSTAFKYELHLP